MVDLVLTALILVIALINGGWMIFDGFHVIVKGKYFGSEEPGPWSKLVTVIGLNPHKMGIPFIILGIFWMFFAIALILFQQSWAWYGAIIIAVATMWYLPVGTIFSVVHLAILWLFRSNLIA